MANTYAGMQSAYAAVKQIGSLGQAITERQTKLNGLDTDIAATQARLTALQTDVTNNVNYGEGVLQAAGLKADQIVADAQTKADALTVAATAQAAQITANAQAQADTVAAGAQSTLTTMKAEQATLQASIDSMAAHASELQGQVSDLDTKLAVSRSSLRQLLGDSTS